MYILCLYFCNCVSASCIETPLILCQFEVIAGKYTIGVFFFNFHNQNDNHEITINGYQARKIYEIFC